MASSFTVELSAKQKTCRSRLFRLPPACAGLLLRLFYNVKGRGGILLRNVGIFSDQQRSTRYKIVLFITSSLSYIRCVQHNLENLWRQIKNRSRLTVLFSCSPSCRSSRCNARGSETGTRRLQEVFGVRLLQGLRGRKYMGPSTRHLPAGRGTPCCCELRGWGKIYIVSLEHQIGLGLHRNPRPIRGGNICYDI
jgi:hypothetical protein